MDMSLIARGQKYTDRVSHTSKNTLRSMVGDTAEQRSKNIKETFSLVRSLLQGGARDIDDNTIRPVRPFGIEIGEKMIAVTGRLIRQPTLMLNVTNYSRGKWSLQGVHACPRNLRPAQWDVLVISPGKMLCSADVRRMMEYIFDRCNQMNIRCFRVAHNQKTYKLWINSTDLESYDRLQRSLFNLQKEHDLQNLVFLFCIIEGTVRESCYGNLKRLCETRFGWLTQCCLKRHLDRRYKLYLTPIPPEDIPPNDPYFGNIALRVNAKLGGTNTALDFRQLFWNIFKDQPVIIFGANVTHLSPDQRQRQHANGKVAEADDGDEETEADTAGLQSRQIRKEKMRKSCVAVVVASMNWPNPSQYCARVVSQVENIGTKVDLGEMVVELVDAYIQKNGGKKPTRAVFFRDGVSAGEFEKLINTECKEMNEALRSKCPGVKVTWLISQRSHHTRFFRKDEAGKIRNVEAGTVVDSDIVQRSQFFDFYLASHTTSSGTLKATHYSVLDDENDFSADEIERFVFNLCRTSVRCGRTVAVVPPLLYAHLAASNARSRYARTSDITDVPPTSEVIDTMYFC